MKYIEMFAGIGCSTVAWHKLGWKPLAFAEIEPFPSAVLAHHYPGVPNLGDMTKVDWSQYRGKVDVVVGGSPCFPAGTLVLCRRGLIPIESVTPDDEAYTHTGLFRRVLRVGSKVADTVILKGQGHNGLEVTPEHPIYSSSYRRMGWKRDENGKQHPEKIWSDPEWTEAKDMAGRFWAQPAWFPFDSIPDFERRPYERLVPTLSEAFFWMLGAYVGNGWTGPAQRSGRPDGQQSGAVFICTGHHKADDLEVALKASGLSWNRSKERTATRFRCDSLPLRRWLDEHFGKYASGKTLPAWLLCQPQVLREAFHRGYMFTDGSKWDGAVSATTISRKLSVGLKLLWHSLGYSVTISRCQPNRVAVIEGRRVNEAAQYSVKGFESARSSVQIGPHRYGCVRKVLPGRESVPVFNLEVDQDNSYTADGIVVHNCQAFSVAGLRNSLDDHRGNLTLEYVRAIKAIQPRFAVWENVPGVLSTKDNAFGCFLAALVGAPEAIEVEGRWPRAGVVSGPEGLAAWRCVNSQYFGVPQSRQRILLVCCPPGSAEFPARILFEPARSPRLFIEGQKARRKGPGFDLSYTVSSKWFRGSGGPSGDECYNLVSVPAWIACECCDEFYCTIHDQHAFECSCPPVDEWSCDPYSEGNLRRFAPLECERLMGLPDDYTNIAGALDRHRYKAIGNGMVIPCMEWLGRRIQMHAYQQEQAA